MAPHDVVAPAQAGAQRLSKRHWVPAFAGTTTLDATVPVRDLSIHAHRAQPRGARNPRRRLRDAALETTVTSVIADDPGRAVTLAWRHAVLEVLLGRRARSEERRVAKACGGPW